MVAQPLPQNVSGALQYGPDAQSKINRSRYLAQYLEQMGSSQPDIRSPLALAANLGAVALTRMGQKKADREALEAVQGERNSEIARLLAGLQKPAVPPPAQTQGPAPPPQQAMPQQPAPPPMAQAPQQQPQQPQQPAVNPQDLKLLAAMIEGEAGGEGRDGKAAAGSVALNRQRKGYGGAKSLADVIMAPKQFEAMSKPGRKPSAESLAIAEGLLSGQIQDPTRGAMNFLNPELQAQLGRAQPSWAPQGQGQRIGKHVFYGGVQSGVEPQLPPPIPRPMPQGPVQLAMNGPPQPGMIPSGPATSPQAGPGPAALPQAAAGPTPGAFPGPQTMGPTPDQIALVERLLRDPRTYEQGRAMAVELQQKATQPVKLESQSVNGVPFLFNPYTGERFAQQIPQEARTQTMSAQQAGLQGAPQGLNVQVDPFGGMKDAPGGPPSGYQNVGGQQSFIPGGAADPRAGMNLVNNEGKLRDDYAKEVAPYIAAREGYQKVIQAARGGTPADDIALVFGYMKTLDPGSTVREGEQATVQNSGTIPQTVQNMYNKLITGQGRLLPEQRSQFASSAERQFQVYQKTADAANQRYGQLAQQYGFEPGRITRQFDPIQGYEPPKAPVPEAASRAYNSMKLNPNAPMGAKDHPFLARDDATLQRLDTPANRGKFVITPRGELAVIE